MTWLRVAHPLWPSLGGPQGPVLHTGLQEGRSGSLQTQPQGDNKETRSSPTSALIPPECQGPSQRQILNWSWSTSEWAVELAGSSDNPSSSLHSLCLKLLCTPFPCTPLSPTSHYYPHMPQSSPGGWAPAPRAGHRLRSAVTQTQSLLSLAMSYTSQLFLGELRVRPTPAG